MLLTLSPSTVCQPVHLVPPTAITVQDQIQISVLLAIPTSISPLPIPVLIVTQVVILAPLVALTVQLAKLLSPISWITSVWQLVQVCHFYSNIINRFLFRLNNKFNNDLCGLWPLLPNMQWLYDYFLSLLCFRILSDFRILSPLWLLLYNLFRILNLMYFLC